MMKKLNIFIWLPLIFCFLSVQVFAQNLKKLNADYKAAFEKSKIPSQAIIGQAYLCKGLQLDLSNGTYTKEKMNISFTMNNNDVFIALLGASDDGVPFTMTDKIKKLSTAWEVYYDPEQYPENRTRKFIRYDEGSKNLYIQTVLHDESESIDSFYDTKTSIKLKPSGDDIWFVFVNMKCYSKA